MKLKAASGYACYVKDLDVTAAFYEKLGLTVKQRLPDRLLVYLNWFRIDFIVNDTESPAIVQQELSSSHKGDGAFFYFSVDNVDVTYEEVVTAGLQPLSQPQDMSWGNREFVIRDPDGYKVVLFKRKIAKNPTD